MWPVAQEIEIQEWSVEDLQEGDLVFGQKADGALVQMCKVADEPWLHVGSVVRQGEELCVVELRGDRFLLSELSFFFGPRRYVAWGAARLRLRPECFRTANEWMLDHLNGGTSGTQVYAWDDLVLAGVIAASHRGLFARFPAQVRAAIASAGAYCKESLRYRGETSLTCSAFVQLAYEAAADTCVIEHPRWRSGDGAWPPRVPQVDELFELAQADLDALAEFSLIDVYQQSQAVDRGVTTTQPRPGHVAEGLKVLIAAVAGFVLGDEPQGDLGVDSRWVTPGDLWRSPSVLERGYVTPPEDWR